VPVDVSEGDLNIDPEAAEAAVGARTRFVLPVHLYGQLADMRRILDLAARRDLHVVEDACQAHGAERDGLRAGACSLAGALVTDDAAVASRARALREHGQTAKYEHAFEGYTARLDTIQALALLRKLPHLDEWTAQRREAARLYSEVLAGTGDLEFFPVAPGSDPVWHVYLVRTSDADGLATFLRERGVVTGRHYPKPPHLSGAYAWLGKSEGEFPVTESLARRGLSLPIFPGITEEQIAYVGGQIGAFFDA
jgi:dTDP-4-amino-4,6-dideoxygalactose transaminase